MRADLVIGVIGLVIGGVVGLLAVLALLWDGWDTYRRQSLLDDPDPDMAEWRRQRVVRDERRKALEAIMRGDEARR